MKDHNSKLFWPAFQFVSGVICRKLLAGVGNTESSLSVGVPSLCSEIIFPMPYRDTDVKYTYEVCEL